MQNTCLVCKTELSPWFTRETWKYMVCDCCGTVSTLPIPSMKEITAHYLRKFNTGNYKLARVFAQQYLRIYEQFMTVLNKELAERNTIIKGKKILDVGCFTGDFLGLAKAAGAKVYGTELQKEAVAIAEKNLPGRVKRSTDIKHAFPREKFDIVTLFGLIEHVTDPEALFTEVDSVLNPAGLLMIQTPNVSSLLAQISGALWPPLAPIEHIYVFSSRGIKELLVRHGYSDITIRTHIKWLPVKYVYAQFHNFGRVWLPVLAPLEKLVNVLPNWFSLPFYGGEMLITAWKK